MKEKYYSKNMKPANRASWNNHWREATDGEALYRWLPAGAGKGIPAPVLFSNGYLPNLKNWREAPSSSHYPMFTCNIGRNIILKKQFILAIQQKSSSPN
ncbi:MAG: hypothetical protein R6V36_06985, partial [Psychroflexus sp.]